MRTQSDIKKVAFAILFYFLLPFISKEVQALPFRFIQYEVEDGLPSNTVRCITQDSRGFMWFGTENGLSRFDGYTFKVFQTNPGDSTSLGNNYIYALLEDSRNSFWVGSDEGAYLYDPEMETFSFFDRQTSEGEMIRSQISCIQEDGEGNIWFATLGQGIFVFNHRTNELVQHTADQSNTLCSNSISSLYIDKTGTLWAMSPATGGHLNRYNGQTFEPFPVKGSDKITENLSIYAVTGDDNGSLWLGTWDNGICKIDLQTHELTSYIAPGTHGGILHVHALCFYQPDILIVSSDDGLTAFNTQTQETTLMTATEFNDESLSNKFAYPIYKDREGGLWVGTYYGGINYSSPQKKHVEGYKHSIYSNSVNGNIISRFCEDRDGNIWIGTDDGGLSHFNTRTKTFTNYIPETGKNSLSYHNIHALFLDRDKLWIGTYSGGLNILDLKTGKFKLYIADPNDPNSIDGNSIYSIFKDRDGQIWLGSMYGISLYNPEQDNFTHLKTIQTTTSDIIQDDDGFLWFATWGKGLFRFDPKTNEWEHFVYDRSALYALPSNQVNCFCLDTQKRLWVGTDDGLCLYDPERKGFIPVHLKAPNVSIRTIISERNYLWITTANGLITYLPETNENRVFFKSDGLQSDQFNMKAGLLASSGLLYLGTINGFSILNPTVAFENNYIPPVVITNLQIFNQDETIRSKGVLRKSISHTNKIELSHYQNVFSVEYAALSYCVPVKNQYQYILEGFDKDWNIVGNQRKATYTNLPAGTYTLKIKASNNDGNWNEEGTSLTIMIHPPFWKTTAAYIVYILLLFSLTGSLIYLNRKRTERRQNARIRQLRTEKEKELHDAKINFFTLIAHEIRTPVSLIIGPLEKIMDNLKTLPPALQNNLKIIDRNSQRLLSLINQLLDFRKAEQNAFIIRFSKQNIAELLQNLYIRFKPMAEQSGITISILMEGKTVTADVDAEAVTKIISNLLTNALKYTKDKIVIECSSTDKLLTIKVTDNGRGISEQEQKNIFLPFYQISQNSKPGTGLGLSLAKLLTDAHHGMIEVESVANEYTTFILTLPIRQEQDKNASRIDLPSDVLPEKITIPEETEKTNQISSPTLLIVEDNSDLRMFLQDSFVSSYHILAAENGQVGLDILKSHPVDLIINDVMMPVMDGIAFCREIKSNLSYSHIPLVLLTAKTDNFSKLSGIRNKADAYLEKPFSLQVLRAQVENLIESRKELRKKFSEMPFVQLDSIAGNDADKDFLAKLDECIEKNFSNMDFSINQLAEELGISRSGLFTKIKNLVGMTPNELIQVVRLKKAAQLLATRKYRVNEICYQVGFTNPSYFSKCFQKQFGMLPKEFINKTIE